jgi:hypothetical protein
MILRNSVIPVMVLAMMLGCSKSDDAGKSKGGKLEPFKIKANNFTDGKKWRKGVSLKETGKFYFIIKQNDETPVAIGDTVVFAKSGETSIENVIRFKNKNDSSIFVTVDKKLDPDGDGYPKVIKVIPAR